MQPESSGLHDSLSQSAAESLLESIAWNNRDNKFSNIGGFGWEREKSGVLVRGAGARATELAARFVRRLVGKKLDSVTVLRTTFSSSQGLHLLVRRPLVNDDEVNFVVRFHAQGTDAVLEWRRCELPGRLSVGMVCFEAIAGTFIASMVSGVVYVLLSGAIEALKDSYGKAYLAIAAGWFVFFWRKMSPKRMDALKWVGSAALAQDLQLSVRATLEEVIDEAQLTDAVRSLDDKGGGRVI
ncbi:MAG: hypothetical protein JNJ83_13610 [Verrucomicrobiaceae bacterium]|nr:hypothetical protein [Verrucomicrobiaceae bacterium]